MRRFVVAWVLCSFAVAYTPLAHAYTSPGRPSGYVNDFAQVLSAQTKQTLENELTSLEKTTSNEISVVTVPSMGGDYIENYAVKLFEEWKIGKKDRDNGVLLVLSIEERKMRIEVGYGLEGALPDSIAQSILNNEMMPKLKAGDYDGAVTAGVHAIEQAIKGEYTSLVQTQDANRAGGSLENGIVLFLYFLLPFISILASIFARSRSWWAGGIVGAIGGAGVGTLLALSFTALFPLVIVATLLGLFFDYVVSRGYQSAKARGVTPPWWTGGSGRSGSGGGFGGFGGGSSGGGGASGSW